DGVGRPRARAGERIFHRLRFQILARYYAVDEAAVVHLLGAERTAGEHHLLKLAQAHGLDPGPHARAPAGVAERRMAEQGVVRGDDQIGIAGLVEVPAITIALCLDDADLLEFLQRTVAGPGFRIVVGE